MYIKIAHITHLQDARYCAAMGFQLISFSLLQGDEYALPAQQIREITGWLSGPKYVLECNEASVEALKEIHGTFPYHYIEIPQADWEKISFLPAMPLIVQAAPNIALPALAKLIEEVETHHKDSKVQIHLESEIDYLKYEKYFSSLFIEMESMASLTKTLQQYKNLPWGFSICSEEIEADGGLDYEKLDRLCEIIQEI